jgi:hypothetical protein
MAITQAFCNSFKEELLAMTPHTASDDYKIALFSSAATLNKNTTLYNAANEVPDSGTYVAGGQSLVGFTAGLDGDTAYIDWTSDPQWTAATIAAAGALIYNATRGNRALCVLDFGGVITSTNGTFDVTLPAPAAATALIRIA